MEDPVAETPALIHLLTQGNPREQAEAIDTYFTPDASFTHPFCRTGHWAGSRNLIHAIYRWYKVMSPRIRVRVVSVAFDETNLRLYATVEQVFAIFFIPFHRAPVTLTTILTLVRDPGPDRPRYRICAQNDLYQVDQFVRFFAPWGIGTTLVLVWHLWATTLCVLGAWLFTPWIWFEQRAADHRRGQAGKVMETVGRVMDRRFAGGMRDEERLKGEKEELAGVVGEVADGVKRGWIEGEGRVRDLMGFGSEGGGGRPRKGQAKMTK